MQNHRCTPFAWLERNTTALIIGSRRSPRHPQVPPGTLRPRSRSIPFSRGLPLFCFCTGWDYCAGRAVVSKSRARCCGSVKSRKSRESLRPQDWVPNAQKSDTDHRRLCEQRLDLSRQNFAARLDQRDFRDQFFDEHIAKRIEVSCDQDKSTGPTDHVLSIVVFKPPWRIRVFRSPQGVGENNQAVDRNPSPNCLVSRRAHITAAIVIAVSRHIDCTPRGVEGRTRELRQGKIEPAADGRAVGKRTGYFQQLISKLPGAIQVLDQGPIDDESL